MVKGPSLHGGISVPGHPAYLESVKAFIALLTESLHTAEYVGKQRRPH